MQIGRFARIVILLLTDYRAELTVSQSRIGSQIMDVENIADVYASALTSCVRLIVFLY